jgi:uncharacterized membrane protein YhaH (DUF805 family)
MQVAQLPAFSFPVVAWAPEPATGDPADDGTREFLSLRDLTTSYFPQSDLRLGWTFVDAEGNCWTAASSQVAGRADAWWKRALPRWIHSPAYRLAFEFAERPPMAFDKVKGRLLAAVSANPQAYRGYAHQRRQELRAAESLHDLIKSDEARAIERLTPVSLWWQWLFWEGRCSRLMFAGVSAAILTASWLAIPRFHLSMPALLAVLVSVSILSLSAVVRRLHDIGRTGWWLGTWFLVNMLCAVVHDSAENVAVKAAAAYAWQTATLAALAFLALWPGTRGPNRYGHSKRQHSNLDGSVGRRDQNKNQLTLRGRVR